MHRMHWGWTIMVCQWQAFLNLLPLWMRDEVDELGRDSLQELRLRLEQPPELITSRAIMRLNRKVYSEDLRFTVNVASRYSPWTADTLRNGYITTPGGHRIGICGEVVRSDGVMTGIRTPITVCMRVARDFPGIARKAAAIAGSVLIIGPPGAGKTTLLRDLIRCRAGADGELIAVIDEKGEIFPYANHLPCFSAGIRTDVLSGCSKSEGILIALRNMAPNVIAVDEITAAGDCEALLHAGWCGVRLLATAHAVNKSDLQSRPIYRPILESCLFDTLITIGPNKSWVAERIGG